MSDFLEKIDLNKVLQRLLFIFLTLMAQNMVFSHIRPFDVCPLLLPAAAAALGMFEGATRGPLLCLLMGYFADMSFVEHRVFFLLVLPGVSLLSAFLSQFFINRRFFAYMGAAALGLLATAVILWFTDSAASFLCFGVCFAVGLAFLIAAGVKYNR